MIHVLTLNWNANNKIQKLSPSLKKSLDVIGKDYIWHIRDNGSNSKEIDYMDSVKDLYGDSASIHKVSHNRSSFAEGMNFLFKEAAPTDDDLILLLNNDIEIADPSSLKSMCNLHSSGVGIVGSRLLYSGTDNLQHAGVIFGKRYGNMPYHFRHKEKSDSDAEKNREFQAVTAACALMSAKDWKDIDGFDEKYWWAFEDIDLCLKLKYNLKKKVVYCGKTKIFHEESASLKKNPVNKIMMPQNVNRFKDKWTNIYKLDHEEYLKNKKYNLA